LTRTTKKIAIAIIGEPQVGKTNLIRLLDKDAESRGTSTILKSSNTVFEFWELQTSSSKPENLEIFSRSFLQRSEPFNRYLLIVTDSTREDVNQIKYSLGFLRKSFPNTRLAIIANKQDMHESLSKTHIEKMTKLPTLEISTKDPQHRSRFVNFLSYLIGFDVGL
jgi:signal recognition particle receptor subunit beta